MNILIKVDFKAKLVQNFSYRNSKKTPVIQCVVSVWMKSKTFVFISKTLCVLINLGRVEKYIAFIFFCILNSMYSSFHAYMN